MSARMLMSYGLATLIRLFLLKSVSSRWNLASRVEVATPINSYGRLVEGIFMENHNVDPYSGVMFHEPPLVLRGMKFLMEGFPQHMETMWILLDLLIAYILGKVARHVVMDMLHQQRRDSENYHPDAVQLDLDFDPHTIVKYTQLLYLFNPYTLINCAAKTTTVLDNLVLALFLLCLMKKQWIPSCFFLALATYKGLYPIVLLSPLCLTLSEKWNCSGNLKETVWKVVTPTVATFAFFLIGLLWMSYELMGRNPDFVYSTYGFILSVPDLTPNMGLFWYFFTEMFEHFRVFFVCTFQLNLLVYVIPLSIHLRRTPFLLSFALLGLIAIFKSYPGYGDVGFYLSLLPILKRLFPFCKQLLIVACMLLASTVLGPIAYHLWIYSGSANANYYFAINLVFGTAQIFLITDLLFAEMKRNFYLENGIKELRASQRRGEKVIVMR